MPQLGGCVRSAPEREGLLSRGRRTKYGPPHAGEGRHRVHGTSGISFPSAGGTGVSTGTRRRRDPGHVGR